MMLKKLFLLPLLLSAIPANANAATIPTPLLDGKWLIEFQSQDIGLAKTVVTFHRQDSTFSAHTRKGAVSDILNFWQASLARIMTDDFQHGALLNITEGTITKKRGTLILHGIFQSALGDYYFDGEVAYESYYGGGVVKGKLNAELTNANGETRGTLTGKMTKPALPLSDYPAIVERVFDSAKTNIYSPSLLQTNKWQRFKTRMDKVAPKIQDDVEMVFAFFYYADKLPISHFSLLKKNTAAKQNAIHVRHAHLSEKSTITAYLNIESFAGSAEEIDSLFAIILQRQYQNLIVDLRGNQGGSIEAGMAFSKNVVDSVLQAGIFLTQKWFAQHDSVPAVDAYDRFPHFTKSNSELILEGIHKEAGLVLKVVPDEETFNGQLFVLTDQQTASTCEPIVYALKQHDIATIVGQTTAGSMLNAESFALSDGFTLIVPTADYYASDGYHIDQTGVIPDIDTKADNALHYVMDNLVTP